MSKKTGKGKIVGFRVSAGQQAKLSTLAARLQLTQSEVLRVLVDSAEVGPVQVALPAGKQSRASQGEAVSA